MTEDAFLVFEGTGDSYPIGRDGLRIGRHPNNDVVLSEEIVSREQASVRHAEGRYVLKDEGSTNGTFVNARRINEQVLRDGDEIEFGVGGPTARFEHQPDTIGFPIRPKDAPTTYEVRCPSCSFAFEIGVTHMVSDSGALSFLRLESSSLPAQCQHCGSPLQAERLDEMVR